MVGRACFKTAERESQAPDGALLYREPIGWAVCPPRARQFRRAATPTPARVPLERLNLAEAFARYGAQLQSKLRGLSAVAADGAIVLACDSTQLSRPSMGVLRHEGDLQANPPAKGPAALLAPHLAQARDGELPLRIVVVTAATERAKRAIHVRTDLVGELTSFDGTHYVVDFSRIPQPPRETKVRRKR